MVQQRCESSHGSFCILRKETVQLKCEISYSECFPVLLSR